MIVRPCPGRTACMLADEMQVVMAGSPKRLRSSCGFLCRELSAQNTDAEADYFEQRLREREAARKQAAAPLPGGITIERTRQYETDL